MHAELAPSETGEQREQNHADRVRCRPSHAGGSTDHEAAGGGDHRPGRLRAGRHAPRERRSPFRREVMRCVTAHRAPFDHHGRARSGETAQRRETRSYGPTKERHPSACRRRPPAGAPVRARLEPIEDREVNIHLCLVTRRHDASDARRRLGANVPAGMRARQSQHCRGCATRINRAILALRDARAGPRAPRPLCRGRAG